MLNGNLNLPGPGDPETWSPCEGHPMDPHTEPDDDQDAIATLLSSPESVEELVADIADSNPEGYRAALFAVVSGSTRELTDLVTKRAAEIASRYDIDASTTEADDAEDYLDGLREERRAA